MAPKNLLANFSSGNHLQLIIVIPDDKNGNKGLLYCFEREMENRKWTLVSDPMPAVLGKNGLAWGLGMYEIGNKFEPQKVEGDKKTPLGIFSLGTVFGFQALAGMKDLQMPYLELQEGTEAVDDPSSKYYNHIVDSCSIHPLDWSSSEKMRDEKLYALGLVIHHNFPIVKPKRGSAIFLHIWESKDTPTAGCTALCHEDVSKIVFWLSYKKNPLLIQLDKKSYDCVKKEIMLPPIE